MRWVDGDGIYKLLVDWYEIGEEDEAIVLNIDISESDVCYVKINIDDEIKAEYSFYQPDGVDINDCKREAIDDAKELIKDEINRLEALLKKMNDTEI